MGLIRKKTRKRKENDKNISTIIMIDIDVDRVLEDIRVFKWIRTINPCDLVERERLKN